MGGCWPTGVIHTLKGMCAVVLVLLKALLTEVKVGTDLTVEPRANNWLLLTAIAAEPHVY